MFSDHFTERWTYKPRRQSRKILIVVLVFLAVGNFAPIFSSMAFLTRNQTRKMILETDVLKRRCETIFQEIWIILFVSSKRRRLEARNFAIIFIFIPFTTCEKNKQVVVLRMAFRARKVLGTFEKRAPARAIAYGPHTGIFSIVLQWIKARAGPYGSYEKCV